MVIGVQGGTRLAREVIPIPVGYWIYARGDFVTEETIAVGS